MNHNLMIKIQLNIAQTTPIPPPISMKEQIETTITP